MKKCHHPYPTHNPKICATLSNFLQGFIVVTSRRSYATEEGTGGYTSGIFPCKLTIGLSLVDSIWQKEKEGIINIYLEWSSRMSSYSKNMHS